MDHRTFAWIDMRPSDLAEFAAMLPDSVQIVGTVSTDLRRGTEPVCRFALDVSATGIDVAGEWIAVRRIRGASRTLELKPRSHL